MPNHSESHPKQATFCQVISLRLENSFVQNEHSSLQTLLGLELNQGLVKQIINETVQH